MKKLRIYALIACVCATQSWAEEGEGGSAPPTTISLPEPAFSTEFRAEAVRVVLDKVAGNLKPDSSKKPGPLLSAGWKAYAKISKTPGAAASFAANDEKFWRAADYTQGFLPYEKNSHKEKFGGDSGARKLAGLACFLESLPKSAPDKANYIYAYVEGAANARPHQTIDGLWGKDFLGAKKGDRVDLETSSLLAFVQARGVNEGYRMMWLDGTRVAVMRTWRNLARCVGPDGRMRVGVRGQRNVEEATGAFLLAGAEIFRLASEMQQPMAFVSSEQYQADCEAQKKAIADLPPATKASSLEAMRKVCQWQLGNLFKGSAGDAQAPDRSWFRGAFLAGVIVAARETQDSYYWDLARKISEENQWQPGPNFFHDGNDLAITQAYLALYLKDRSNPAWIQPTREAMNALAAKAVTDRKEWSWADALFMAPAAWAQMSLATGEPSYRKRMNHLWWDSIELLWDKDAQLFYRDRTFMPQPDGFQIKERNGQKIFWARGNGWVLGGLCNVLEALPADYPERHKYEQLLKTFCASLAAHQGADGLWRASLLDPDSYPLGETSGSTFFCYGIAWGINHGVLEREKFTPVAAKAWHALMACVETDGKLGYVQLPAESPRSPAYRSKNVEYAAGAFLAAGGEMIKLLPQ